MINDVYLFHGSNATLLDDFLVSGTYFTEDLEKALKYGKTIYVFNLTAKHRKQGLFTKTWEGHYVSHSAIPLDYLTVLKVSPKR